MSSPHTEHGLAVGQGQHQAQSQQSWLTRVLIVICLLLVYAVTQKNDELDRLRLHALQAKQLHQHDLGTAQLEATRLAANAYAQGQRDAIDALQAESALQVAQLCQAWRHRTESALAQAPMTSSHTGS